MKIQQVILNETKEIIGCKINDTGDIHWFTTRIIEEEKIDHSN